MRMSYEQIINMLLERTADNTRQLRKMIEQRRNGMEDLYGVSHSANGDAQHPATFYISLSPDYTYLQRFAFKLVIKPFSSTVSGVSGGGSMRVGETTLESESGSHVIAGTSTLDDGLGITPNPHTHDVSGSIGDVDYGIKRISTSSANWEIHIDGVDITDYLIEQHDGYWIDGEDVYPTNDLDDDIANFYDILDVASMMQAEIDEATDPDEKEALQSRQSKILRRGFKKVEIFSDAPFAVDAYLYLKYANINR